MEQDLLFGSRVALEASGSADNMSFRSSAFSDDEESQANRFLHDDYQEYGNQVHGFRSEPLPPHACSYCEVSNPKCVVKCETCNRWFCNSRTGGGRSHIITHLILSKHNSISLHEESDLGDTTLECYNCGNKNVFLLGFVSAQQQNVVVLLCRVPCAQVKDKSWDTNEWQPLIDDKQLLSWVATIPTGEDIMNAREITSKQIVTLESKWRTDNSATIQDMEPEEILDEEVTPILMRYNDAYQYQRSFAPLVKLEADHDKQMKESASMERVSVRWGLGLNRLHTASFALSYYESSGMKISIGDAVVLHHTEVSSVPWSGNGIVVRLPNSHSEEFTVELISKRSKPPINSTSGFTVEFIWKGTSFVRMQNALKKFAIDKISVNAYLYHQLLGHEVPSVEFDVKLQKSYSIPGKVKLNQSQENAVRMVMKRPLSLIQGPPGTGKTVTSATIIYHLHRLKKERILVCAPSNVAVDHLTLKLEELGLNAVRIYSKSREDVDAGAEHLALHTKVQSTAKGELKKLFKLKANVGELSAGDSKRFTKLCIQAEKEILRKADIICTTCVGAGSSALSMPFKTVLIDESTQASEPACLIPIVKGAQQVILVGDHQQLGPVILNSKASDAGLKQSLFERLVVLGHVPIRLEVQYRMNPFLSEFPSNMFYEGSLQNGVTPEQRTMLDEPFPWPIRNIPMMFWSNYGREELSASGTSYVNRIEAMNCEKVVSTLFKNGIQPEQIGVVTPYEGQRSFITQYMDYNGTHANKSLYEYVEVASVDAFQGREKDFIIFSCVRANDKQLIGFLSDPRRLNVALTRAKYGLIILGNPRALCKNALWNHLANHFREKGCLVEGQLENLQLCTMSLRRPNYTPGYGNSEYDSETSTVNDFETSSVSSFIPESLPGNGRSRNSPFGHELNWPALGTDMSGLNVDESDYNGDSDNATISHDDNAEYYGANDTREIDSSFSTKLKKMDAASSDVQRRVEDDVRSLTSSFASQMGLR